MSAKFLFQKEEEIHHRFFFALASHGKCGPAIGSELHREEESQGA